MGTGLYPNILFAHSQSPVKSALNTRFEGRVGQDCNKVGLLGRVSEIEGGRQHSAVNDKSKRWAETGLNGIFAFSISFQRFTESIRDARFVAVIRSVGFGCNIAKHHSMGKHMNVCVSGEYFANSVV